MNVPIYNGSPSWSAGLTPFGFDDSEDDFKTDPVKVA